MARGRGRLTPEQWSDAPPPETDVPQAAWNLGNTPNTSPEEPDDEPEAERSLLFVGSQQEALDISLLLASQARPHWIETIGPETAVLVPEKRRKQDERLVRAWRRENRGFFSQLKAQMPTVGPAPLWLLTPPIALFFVQRLSEQGDVLREAGLADAAKIVGGEWHRALTALTLHADLGHVAGNTFWSFWVLTAIHSRLPWPFAAWLVLFSGIFGNITTALLYTTDHRALGFSTALFGALGLLAGIEFRHPLKAGRALFRRAIPLAGAVFLGIWMGTGEGTDIAAHLFGLLWGVFFGAVLPARALFPAVHLSRTESGVLAAALWLTIAIAWRIALGNLIP